MNSYIIVFVYETKLAMVQCKLYEKLLNDREKEGEGGRGRESGRCVLNVSKQFDQKPFDVW